MSVIGYNLDLIFAKNAIDKSIFAFAFMLKNFIFCKHGFAARKAAFYLKEAASK